MKVSVKDFNVKMELGNNGIEFEIRDNNDKFIGDLVINKSKLIWCKGKCNRKNGESVKLEKFIEWMEE